MRSRQIISLFILMLLTACSGGDESPPGAEVIPEQQNVEPVAQPLPASPALRIVIRDADLAIITDSPAQTVTQINTLADESGGWVVSSNTRSHNSRASASTTIRIPSQSLDQTLDAIRTLADEVESETITGRDVTQEFIDLESQLTNLQRTEAQLQTLLERANTVSEVLSVQEELTQIRGEIEVTQGRINFLSESAAFSSIRVNVQTETQFSQNWNPGGVVEDSIDALIRILQLAVNLLIIVVIVGLPVVVLFVLPGLLAYRYGKRRGWWGKSVQQSETN